MPHPGCLAPPASLRLSGIPPGSRSPFFTGRGAKPVQSISPTPLWTGSSSHVCLARERQTNPPPCITRTDTMTDAVPARMFARAPQYNNRAERQHSVINLPLVAALVEPGSRYSFDDPRIAPPAPTRRPPAVEAANVVEPSSGTAARNGSCGRPGARSVDRAAGCHRRNRHADWMTLRPGA